VVDPCLGHPVARAWLDRLAAGETLPFREFVAREPDLELRDFVLEAILETTHGWAEWIDKWVQDEPTSGLAHMVRGRHLVHIAWQARSHLRAKEVSSEQFNQFFARLDLAWKSFSAALELAPDEGSTYAMMIDAAKGLQLGIGPGMDLYREAQSRRPWQQLAHLSMIQLLAPKWSHTTESMFQFARDASATAPEGSGIHCVIPEAHVEAWLESGWGNDYWKLAHVRTEILGAAARSIDSPRLTQSPWLPRIRSSFAYTYCLLDERERARREFELIGPFVAGPFRFAMDPIKTARGARNSVGAPLPRALD
jgi:Domain of unknown function (DUF4034)